MPKFPETHGVVCFGNETYRWINMTSPLCIHSYIFCKECMKRPTEYYYMKVNETHSMFLRTKYFNFLQNIMEYLS
jgi:hypothetical protein